MTSEGFGLAVLAFVAAFLGAFLAARRETRRQRITSGLRWGAIFGGGQVARALFPVFREPIFSILVAVAVVGLVLLFVGVELRSALGDSGDGSGLWRRR